MAAFWAVFIFGGSGPAITAHGSLDLKQEIQIQIQIIISEALWVAGMNLVSSFFLSIVMRFKQAASNKLYLD
jgi:tellurite resistance protein TehA-like permease